jgi:hypothetical protein
MRLISLLVAAMLAQAPIRTADITARGLKPSDFPRMTKLSPDVYAYEQIDPTKRIVTANNLIVVSSEGVLVAEGQGTPENVKRLVADIATLTPQPIKYVIVGSEHGDHTGGDTAFPETATFVVHPFSKATIERRIGRPAETVADKRVLSLGGTDVHVMFLGRAHTGGDLEVYEPDLPVDGQRLSQRVDRHAEEGGADRRGGLRAGARVHRQPGDFEGRGAQLPIGARTCHRGRATPARREGSGGRSAE